MPRKTVGVPTPTNDAGSVPSVDPALSSHVAACPAAPLSTCTREKRRYGTESKGGWYMSDVICSTKSEWEAVGGGGEGSDRRSRQRVMYKYHKCS
jgi:hypothetical protein